MSNQTDQKPVVLTDVYGNQAPNAARFGKGGTNEAGVAQATDARREVKPGDYSKR